MSPPVLWVQSECDTWVADQFLLHLTHGKLGSTLNEYQFYKIRKFPLRTINGQGNKFFFFFLGLKPVQNMKWG